MRKGKESPAGKLVTVFLSLVVALMLSGMGYGLWSDTVGITANVKTATWGSELSPGVPSEGVSDVVGVDTLKLTITDASADAYYYYTDFDVHNTGTAAIKIQSISISSPGEVATTVTGDVYVDRVLDGGGTVLGTVEMYVDTAGDSYDITVTIDTVLWNQ